ncbi:hypothetical protein HanRHA438_Chr05g0219751 [Helianthus annuus]|nr:hypothetical protein HanRHA438_Chr05g0219751 [Helianthus annuus]
MRALSAISFKVSSVNSLVTSIISSTDSFFSSYRGHNPFVGSSKKPAKDSKTLGGMIDLKELQLTPQCQPHYPL